MGIPRNKFESSLTHKEYTEIPRIELEYHGITLNRTEYLAGIPRIK